MTTAAIPGRLTARLYSDELVSTETRSLNDLPPISRIVRNVSDVLNVRAEFNWDRAVRTHP